MRPGRFLLGALWMALLLLALQAEARERRPVSYRSLFSLGLEAYEHGRYRDALTLFSEARELNGSPGGPPVERYGVRDSEYLPHYHLGLALFRLGRYSSALQEWELSRKKRWILNWRCRRERRDVERKELEIAAHLLEDRRKELLVRLNRLRVVQERLEKHRHLLATRGGSPEELDQLREITRETAKRSRELEKPTCELTKEWVGEPGQCVERDSEAIQAPDPAELQARASQLDALDVQADSIERGTAAAVRIVRINQWAPLRLEQSLVERILREESLDDLESLESRLSDSRCDSKLRRALREIAALTPISETPEDGRADPWAMLVELERACGEILIAESHRARLESMPVRRDPASWQDTVFPTDAWGEYLELDASLALGNCENMHLAKLSKVSKRIEADWQDGNPTGLIEPRALITGLDSARAHSLCPDTWRAAEADLERARSQLERLRGDDRVTADDLERVEDRIEDLWRWLADAPYRKYYEAGKSVAVLMVVSGYDKSWGELRGTAADLEPLETTLKGLGFDDVRSIVDPTLEDFGKLESWLGKAGKDGRALFYFAGHGVSLPEYGIPHGYLVPAGALPKDEGGSRSELWSMDELYQLATLTEVRDMLFVFDVCFSGLAFEAASAVIEDELSRTEPKDAIPRPSRVFLTADDEEKKVPDTSSFRPAFITGSAGDADEIGDGVILGTELGYYIRRRVEKETDKEYQPLWGRILRGEFAGGDFFVRGPAPQRPTSLDQHRDRLRRHSELDYWRVIARSTEAVDYLAYLQVFGESSQFGKLARYRYEALGGE